MLISLNAEYDFPTPVCVLITVMPIFLNYITADSIGQLKFVETMNIFPPYGNNICADIKTTFSMKGIVIYESYRNRPQD